MKSRENKKRDYYNSYLERARGDCEKQIDKLLESIGRMNVGKAEFLRRRDILNNLLRDGYRSAPQTGGLQRREPLESSTSLSALAYKAISNLNFLGNSPDCSWLSLVFDYSKKDELPASTHTEINTWIDKIRNKLKSIFYDEDSFFYSNVFNNWSDWFIEGCSVLKVDWKNAEKRDISFVNVGASNVSLRCDGGGRITAIAYSYSLTKKEAYDRGLITLKENDKRNTDIQKTILPSGFGDDKVEFIDFCIARTSSDIFPKQLQAPYLRVLINKTDRKAVSVIEEETFPYIVSRAISGQSLPYGNSLLWGSIKSFRYIDFLKNASKNYIEHNANPTILTSAAHADSSAAFGRLVPGAILPGLDPISLRPLCQPVTYTGDISILVNIYNLERAEVTDALLASDVIPPNASQMTATEIMKRELQWNKRILPLIECRKNDFLAPLIRRCIYLLNELEELPILSDVALYNIGCRDTLEALDYLSVQFGGQLLNIANTQEMLDMINFVTYSSNLGLGNLVNGKAVVEKLRQYLNVSSDCIKTEQELQAEQQAIEEARAREATEQYNKDMALAELKYGKRDVEEGEDNVGERIF